MAGAYIVIGGADRARMAEAARRLTFFDEEVDIVTEQGFAAVWVGHDDASLFGPAVDPETGVRLLQSGRVAWSEPEWARASQLRHLDGGLGSRLLLDRYLTGGVSAVERPNGPALIVVWDPRTRSVHLVTDHFGYHPAFLWRPGQVHGSVVATFADAIAADPAAPTTRDGTSVAELLSGWRITPPHTFYREVEYAGAATISTWDLPESRFTRRVYWTPFLEPPFGSIEEAGEALAEATREAIAIRTTPRLSPTVVFASGGMDSRAILFSANHPDGCVGFNLFDVENNESRIAAALCDAAGVAYLGYGRDSDYYPRWHSESSRISGSMHSTEDSHYLGVRDAVMKLGARTVMSGCTTDWLFKGYGLEKGHRQLLGRNLPLFRFTPKRVDAFLPNRPLPLSADVRADVRRRLLEAFEGTPVSFKSDLDRLHVEDRRVRPICYAPSVSGQIMYRIFPYDTFLGDRAIADCYSRIRPAWKLNSDVWGLAIRRVCEGGRGIPDANFNWPVGSSSARKLVAFARGWVARRVRGTSRGSNGGLATEGSWPNLGWYLHNSEHLATLWRSVPEPSRQVIAQALGTNPWATPLSQWATRPNDFFRILTVASHLSASP